MIFRETARFMRPSRSKILSKKNNKNPGDTALFYRKRDKNYFSFTSQGLFNTTAERMNMFNIITMSDDRQMERVIKLMK